MLVPSRVFHVSGVASRESSRPSLNGVYFERLSDASAGATATNGKLLVHSEWPDDDQSEYPGDGLATKAAGFKATIPVGACQDAAKLAPKREWRPILEKVAIDEAGSNGTVKMAATDLESWRKLEPMAIPQDYPNYKGAIPTGEPKARIILSAVLLKDLMATLSKIHPDGEGLYCDVEIHGPDRPVIFRPRTKDGIQTIGMIMPLVEETK